MRSLYVIGVAVLSAEAALAADSVVIEWDPGRPLTWDDFRGPVPLGVEDVRVAATAASISWSYEFAIEMSQDQCAFTIVKLDSAAHFRPDTSWVRPGHRTDAILEHEQIHFDIARLYSEMFLEVSRELIGSVHECNDSSERRATRSAEREISRLAGSLYEDIWQRFRLRQETYDRETRHGIDSQEQARWTRDISASVRTAEQQ